MISNIVLVGWDYQLNKRLAEKLAERLKMHFLAFTELIEYNACDKTKAQILKEGGELLYKKFLFSTAKEVSEFDGVVVAMDANTFDDVVEEKLCETSLGVFVGQSRIALLRGGVEFDPIEVVNFKTRFGGFCSVFVEAAKTDEEAVIKNIMKEILKLYGGGQNG